MKKITHLLKSQNLILLLLFPLLGLAQTANYDISVTTIWNVMDHTSVPGNAHWSNLIGATHNTANEFVSLGTNATTGIRNIAEGGDNVVFTTEVNAAIMAGRADQLLQDGFSPFAGNDSDAGFTSITVNENHSLVTLVSMVAPSPDWFIAINSLDLRSGNPAVHNGWRDTFTIDVFAYDSGTDNGTNYTSGNSPNSPVGIFMVNGFPINGNKMATITFTLNSTLSNSSFETNTAFRLSPNPSNGLVTLSNMPNTTNQVSVYDVLGKEVYNTKINRAQGEINLSDLKSGIYILKISTANQSNTISKKLIIN